MEPGTRAGGLWNFHRMEVVLEGISDKKPSQKQPLKRS